MVFNLNSLLDTPQFNTGKGILPNLQDTVKRDPRYQNIFTPLIDEKYNGPKPAFSKLQVYFSLSFFLLFFIVEMVFNKLKLGQ